MNNYRLAKRNSLEAMTVYSAVEQKAISKKFEAHPTRYITFVERNDTYNNHVKCNEGNEDSQISPAIIEADTDGFVEIVTG